ncbi:MAG: hypothetical protein ABID61_05880 [Candidatus Micrarchaeota archaeon]
MEDVDDVGKQIEGLETKKNELIERIKQLNRRIRYKKYEREALKPFLDQTKDVKTYPLRKRKKAIEFKIATAAYTPKLEREWLKMVREIDGQLKKYEEVERARRKKKYVEQDIEEGEKEIVTIEEQLKEIRTQLKIFYEDAKSARMTAKRTAQAAAQAEEDMVALGDLADLEKEN